MMQKDRNAVILAAGTSSRFVPLSFERPKGLLKVKGEVLIERQIRQLREAGISDITVVTGYKSSMFDYLHDTFGVDLVFNEDYARYNNVSSLIRVADRLNNTYICSSDNYFRNNVFMQPSDVSYYSSEFVAGQTDEYCLKTDEKGRIIDVSIGGEDSWYMVGHVFFNEDFSKAFRKLLVKEYDKESVRSGYWEDLYIAHLKELPPMWINRYKDGEINEFDSLEDLRSFDDSYRADTRSGIIKKLAHRLDCGEDELSNFVNTPSASDHSAFSFSKGDQLYMSSLNSDLLIRI